MSEGATAVCSLNLFTSSLLISVMSATVMHCRSKFVSSVLCQCSAEPRRHVEKASRIRASVCMLARCLRRSVNAYTSVYIIDFPDAAAASSSCRSGLK